MTARDLILLQGEVDKNSAIIGSLQHETALTLASVAGNERALKKHLAALHEEMRSLAELTASVRLRVQGGPTVKTSEVDAAMVRRDKKRSELQRAQHDARTLEGVLKEFIAVEPLRIQELFDTSDANDEVALAMLMDQRMSGVKRGS